MLVRLDAIFEGILGAVLVLAAATGALDGSDFPQPVDSVVLLIVGVLLLVVGLAIWTGRVGLRQLALGNAATALAAVVWLAAESAFSAAGATVVAVTAACLTALAAAQAATFLR